MLVVNLVGEDTGVLRSYKAMDKVLRLKRGRRNWEAQMLAEFEKLFEFNAGPLLTETEQMEWRAMMCRVGQLLTSGVAGDGSYLLLKEKRAMLSEQDAAMWDWMEFCNNSFPNASKPSRYDSTQIHAQAIAHGKSLLLLRAFWPKGCPQTNTERFLRFYEGSAHWTRLMFLCPFLGNAWQSTTLAKNGANVSEQAKAQRAKDQARQNRAMRFRQNQQNKVFSVLFFGCLQHLERISRLHFGMSSEVRSYSSSSWMGAGQSDTPATGPAPAGTGATASMSVGGHSSHGAARQSSKGCKGMHRVADSIERFLAECWWMTVLGDTDKSISLVRIVGIIGHWTNPKSCASNQLWIVQFAR